MTIPTFIYVPINCASCQDEDFECPQDSTVEVKRPSILDDTTQNSHYSTASRSSRWSSEAEADSTLPMMPQRATLKKCSSSNCMPRLPQRNKEFIDRRNARKPSRSFSR
ncbi:expressed unknown protein [Seminavis robusta]|uniref:Uncharacterized protein n=1 Tax=Seminavis robusta TaxID=568900 RepID=A0A9N8DYM9_9STRA|nr:expressed unknown protein [Seminavis robusta]|eukprot:Sro451_g145640.1 n/a (109) ;mRNA; r:9579-9905